MKDAIVLFLIAGIITCTNVSSVVRENVSAILYKEMHMPSAFAARHRETTCKFVKELVDAANRSFANTDLLHAQVSRLRLLDYFIIYHALLNIGLKKTFFYIFCHLFFCLWKQIHRTINVRHSKKEFRSYARFAYKTSPL